MAIRKIRKPDELGDDVRVADDADAEDLAVALRRHDALHVHGAGLDDDADDREDQGQLVGDQLAGGPQAADERVLVGPRPAGHEDADDRDRRDGEGVEHADGRGRRTTASGPKGTTTYSRNVDTITTNGARREHPRSARSGTMSSFWRNLPTSAISCSEPYGPGLHRPQPALHEAHHLEQEEVDERAGRQEHRDQHADDAERSSPPVGELDGEHHRSMSPRMK